MTLSFAAFLARLEDARMPALILAVDGAEPVSADTAVESCESVA
jgi:hypothetical protein